MFIVKPRATNLLPHSPHCQFFWFWFQAAGIAVMAVGIFARVSASNYSALMEEGGFKSAANILIAAGALVMIIGAIGCCGAMKEKKWLLLLVSYKEERCYQSARTTLSNTHLRPFKRKCKAYVPCNSMRSNHSQLICSHGWTSLSLDKSRANNFQHFLFTLHGLLCFVLFVGSIL